MGHLELIVDQRDGDTDTFHVLWRAARQAELWGTMTLAPAPKDSPPDPNHLAVRTVAPIVTDERFDFVMVSSRHPIEEERCAEGRSAGRYRTHNAPICSRASSACGSGGQGREQPAGLGRLPNGTIAVAGDRLRAVR